MPDHHPLRGYPSGTVTLLFTDIEGSTRLWEEHPDAMRAALLQHDDLLRACIESHGGHVFKTMGDAFCAVFPTAQGATAAVLGAQLALRGMAESSDVWTGGGMDDSSASSWSTPPHPHTSTPPVRVRMALHTGVVEERSGDYIGPPLNRVARLLAIGHGGQVLLSAATQELVRDGLPEEVSLRDMGERRLKDLVGREHVFQLLAPGLPADFPPLRSLDARAHNLPIQATGFVGREREMLAVKERLKSSRLLTLTGAGGCGKTRLSLQAAADLIDDYADGVWLIELAPLNDGELVLQAVAQALAVREEPGTLLLATLAKQLRGKQLLLVLDNCEHLVEACALLCEELIASCPGVRILASSREALRIPGEALYRVPSLSTPDPGQDFSPERLVAFEAVRLFLDRAAQVQPAFVMTAENAPALASICRRLDGIPLALELAAARVRAMPVEQIEQRLDQRFGLLTGGSRTALPRHQTLRALIDWSYDLLNEAEKALLCRLSVFSGGWTLEAAEQVCPDEWTSGRMDEWTNGPPQTSSIRPFVHSSIQPYDVLDLLTSLVDKSLVYYAAEGGAARYRLLETVRQYARDRLLEVGEGVTWRSRHLTCFLALAEEAAPHLTGADQQTWLERLDSEHENLRAAFEFAVGDRPDLAGPAGAGTSDQQPTTYYEAGLRLAGALWRFWHVRGYLGEGRGWLSRALMAGPGRQHPEGATEVRAKALSGAGWLAHTQGDFAAAQPLFEESLQIHRKLGDSRGIAVCLCNLGNVAYSVGDYAVARALYEESLAIQRELGDRWGISRWLNNLGAVAYAQGDFSAARALHTESLVIRRDLGDWQGIATSLNNLGVLAHEEGSHVAARALHEESLAIKRELGDRQGIALSLEGLASIAGRGSPSRGAQLWGAAERLRESIGAPVPPNERLRYDRQVAAARSALGGDAAFDATWQEGRAMTLEEAIALALEEEGSGVNPG